MTDHVVDASGLLAMFVSTSKAETPRRAETTRRQSGMKPSVMYAAAGGSAGGEPHVRRPPRTLSPRPAYY